MKQWQEIEGGWTLQRGATRAEVAANPSKIPGKLPTAAFPSVGATADAIPAVCRWFATIPGQKLTGGAGLFLRVSGANAPVKVWVDGAQVGDVLPPWVQSMVDISSVAKDEKPLLVCLEMESPSGTTNWASGEGEALQLGPVLHEAPKIFNVVGPVLVDAVVRADFHTERVRLSLAFHNSAGTKSVLSLRLNSPDAQKGEFKRDISLATENGEQEFEFEVPECKAWTPDHPVLYSFELTIDGAQAVKLPFGFAALTWTEKGIQLNDTPFFVRGVRWDAAGQAGFLGHSNPKAELQRIKEAGFNTVFPSSAPMPESLVGIAQQVGLVVIQNLGAGGLSDSVKAFEHSIATATALVVRQEAMANVLGFVGGDLPGGLLSSKESEWLKALVARRQESIPKGWRKETCKTLVAHMAGTRIEIGHPPTQDPVQTCIAGAKAPTTMEIHRFRLPAPVSIQRQSFLAKHMHPRDPSDLVDQGLGDALFWKKIHKARTSSGKFFVSRLGCPSLLDPERTLESLGNEKSARTDKLHTLVKELQAEMTQVGLKEVWTPSGFATACQQVGAQAVLRQADALAINPRCCGVLVNQWSDTPTHSSGLVGITGEPKPGFELFRKYNRPVRVIAEAALRTPYIMQTAAVRIHMANDNAPGEYSLLLRVKGNNNRIWHQESLPAVSEGGVSMVGKFEFPVGDERGHFTFDMQLSRQGRDVFRTEETFYVPPAANLEAAAQAFRFLGEFPEDVMRHGRSDARAVLVNQVRTFDPKRLQDLLDDAVTGLTVVFAGLEPEDARFLQKHGGLNFPIELAPAASAGGEGYHYVAPSTLFARLPQGIVAGEVFADLLPAWTLARLPGSQVASGFAQLSPSGHWQFKADIQTVPHGKGRLMFHQFRMWDKLGSLALADALFANLADVVRELH
jgi:hypothetical protein